MPDGLPEPIEIDNLDALGAGAVGEPGDRAFYLQACAADAQLTVLVEKEQVALLATEAVAFLDRIGKPSIVQSIGDIFLTDASGRHLIG